MRLFAHNHLGPRVYSSFENGLAYEYMPGKCLDYAVAVDKNVYPLVANKVGKMHRRMSPYAGTTKGHHVFHTLRNWMMLVPMRLADPANHHRMINELPSKATLVNELDELEVLIFYREILSISEKILSKVADLAFSALANWDFANALR